MKKLIKIGLLSLCITMFMTVQTLAAGTTFDTTGKQVGDTVEMSVVISDGTANSGEMILDYDDEVLELVAATKGADVSSTTIIAIDDKEAGKIVIGFADVSKAVQGEIVKLTFKALVAEPQAGYSVNVDCAEWSGEDINSEEDALVYSNYDMVVKGGEAAIINMDADGDGKADINIDTNGDGKADINVDTNGDGIADVDIDTDGDGKADKNLSSSGSGNNGGSSSNGGSSNNGGTTGGSETDEDDSSEEEGTTGDESESGDEGENEDSNNGSTSEPDKDTEANTDADTNKEDKEPVVWPFVVGGIVIVVAVVGFFFYKKKTA